MRRNWKSVYPTSLRHAMELCVDHAREKHNLSVERIADLMGLESHFTLYKWIEKASMPAIRIRPFEHACGIDFVTRYLAHSANSLLVKIPSGKSAKHTDLAALSVAMHETSLLLANFYEGKAAAGGVVGPLTILMEDLAHQRGNVEKNQQPELELDQ